MQNQVERVFSKRNCIRIKDNGIKTLNIAISKKNLFVKSTIFPHRIIQKYSWTSPDGKTHNQMNHILIDRR